MGLQTDSWVGLGEESTPGTAVTPTVFLYGVGKLKLDVVPVDGKGYRVGQRGLDSVRHSIARHKVSGSITDMDAVIPGGLKALFKAALGVVATSVADAVNGPTNHYLYTPAVADYLPSYTIQQATPRLGSSTVDVATFTGCQCSSLKLSVKSGELVGIETEWVGKDQDFAFAAAVPSWPATNVDQLGFVDGVLKFGGAVTAPTSSALGTSTGSALVGVRDFEVTIKNALDDNAPTLGSGLVPGRPAALSGGASDLVSGSFTREYLDRTLIDDAIAQTARGLLATFTGRGPSGTAPYALQLAIPASRLQDPYTPEAGTGDVITAQHKWVGYETATTKAVYAALRTIE